MPLNTNTFIALALILSNLVCLVFCDRTSQKIYYDVHDADFSMCFRRLNLTHEIGCSSSRGGNVGVIHYVTSQADLDWLIDSGTHKPYIPLLTPMMFNKAVVTKLMNSGKINGLLVIHTNLTTHYDIPQSFSPDHTCPNEPFGLYNKSTQYNWPWNPKGNEMAFYDFDFPIAILKNTTHLDFIIDKCYKHFNEPIDGKPRSYPLCAMELKNAMDAAKDTPTCMRRSNMVTNLNPQTYCDPLGDYNVYSFIEPLNSSVPLENDSVTVLAARLDGFSMFYHEDPAADSTVASFVTLLAVVEAIGKVKDTLKNHTQERPLMFALFNGEAWDYIGSSRMIYEMENGFFPGFIEEGSYGQTHLGLHHIKNFIEISQIGKPDEDTLWLHTDPLSMQETSIKTKVEELLGMIKNVSASAGLNLGDTPQDQPLPPASFQTFLRKRSIPGLVLADHNKNYTNQYYNARLDTADNVRVTYPDHLPPHEHYDYVTEGAAHITKVATALARTVYGLTMDSQEGIEEVEASNLTTTHLLYCFLINPQCELFNFSLGSANAEALKRNNGTGLLSPYVSVLTQGSTSRNWVTTLSHNLMAYFLGDPVHVEGCKSLKDCEKQCNDANKYKDYPAAVWHTFQWIQGPINTSTPNQQRTGICLRSNANTSIARSPAFDIKNYDWDSNEYSAWTESRWATDAMKMNVFLVPDRNYEITVLCSGIGLAIVAFVLIYFVHRRAGILFAADTDTH